MEHIYEAIKNRPKEVESLVNKQADLISKMPESQREVFKMISETAKHLEHHYQKHKDIKM